MAKCTQFFYTFETYIWLIVGNKCFKIRDLGIEQEYFKLEMSKMFKNDVIQVS